MTNPDFSRMVIDGWNLRVRPPSGPLTGPVLLAIHGLSGDEHSMDVFSARIPNNYWILSLRAPFLADPGFSWVYKKVSTLPEYTDFSYSAAEIVRRLPTWMGKLEISSNKVDLIGFSQGAALSLCLMNDHPAIFNKAAILAGFLPASKLENPFLGNVSKKKFFVSHGSLDETIPIQLARTFVSLLEKAGASVTYCEEDVGHKLSTGCFKGLVQFFSSSLGQGKQT